MDDAIVLRKVGNNETTAQPESQEGIEPIMVLCGSFSVKRVAVEIFDLLEYNYWTWFKSTHKHMYIVWGNDVTVTREKSLPGSVLSSFSVALYNNSYLVVLLSIP